MDVWQIVIEKNLGTEYWVNDYHVQANDFADAVAAGGDIVAIERNVHTTLVSFTKYRVRPAGSTAQGTVIAVGLNGLAGATTDYLPLYCTARIDMAPASGRVGRKYLKLPISEAAQAGGQFNAGFIDFMGINYITPLLALGVTCKPGGEVFSSMGVVPAVQMRQLRRGSRRRLQPII
jgi:hypothetical protein